MIRALRLAGLVMLVALANGCALFAPQRGDEPPNTAAWQVRQNQYQAINYWTVDARMATALLGWSGSLNWQQAGQDLQISVSGPLGIGGFKAHGDLNHVQVVTSDGQRLQGDPEVLYRQVVGWHFPLRGMRYWALGLPVPGKPSNLSLDTSGRVDSMRQDGWLIQYTEYRDYAGWELPRRMKLEKDDLTVRIVIDNWRDVADS